MGAISALSTAVETLKRNSVLFGVTFVVVLVNFALSGIPYVFPPSTVGLLSLPLSGASLLITPFLVGGLLAMADEGLDGPTRFETFLDGGKANYLRLLGAMVLFGVLLTAIAAAAMIGVVVLAVFAVGMSATGGTGSMAASGGSLAVIALFALVSAFLTLVPMFFLQFYAAAVVVSDLGVVDSFKRSSGLVRQNIVSTLGYTAIAVLVGVVVGLVVSVTSVVATLSVQPDRFSATEVAVPEIGLGAVAVAVVVSVALTTAVSAFGSVYQVAFYEDVLARTPLGDDDAPAVDAR